MIFNLWLDDNELLHVSYYFSEQKNENGLYSIIQVKEVYGDKDELEYDDLNKLVYLEQCIKETLRLHPPATATSRQNPEKDETVDGIYLPRSKLS